MLELDGYSLNPERKYGENGADIIAKKDGDELVFEVIGYKNKGPARSKDFFEIFFRGISRLNLGAKKILLAMPVKFKSGLNQRVENYRVAWKRIGDAFPELEICLIDCEKEKYHREKWNNVSNFQKI